MTQDEIKRAFLYHLINLDPIVDYRMRLGEQVHSQALDCVYAECRGLKKHLASRSWVVSPAFTERLEKISVDYFLQRLELIQAFERARLKAWGVSENQLMSALAETGG